RRPIRANHLTGRTRRTLALTRPLTRRLREIASVRRHAHRHRKRRSRLRILQERALRAVRPGESVARALSATAERPAAPDRAFAHAREPGRAISRVEARPARPSASARRTLRNGL